MRQSFFAIAAAVLVALLFAACGGGDDAKSSTTATQRAATATQKAGTSTNAPTQAPDTTDAGGGSNDDLDACTLLTNDEVAALVGETGDGHLTIDQETSSCFWETADQLKQVEVVVSKGTFDSSILFGGESVDGLGDEAVWVTNLGIMDVLSGNYNFQVSFSQATGTSDEDQKSATKTLAQKVLDRLP